jgi:hypothetical protein
LIALLIASHEAVTISVPVTSVGEQRDESAGSSAFIEVRALRFVALSAAAIVCAREQAVPVALIVSIGAVAIASIIPGIIEASAFVDAIPIAVTISVAIPITIPITATMTITVAISVAISVSRKFGLTNQDAIAFAGLIDAITTIVAVAARTPRVGIA